MLLGRRTFLHWGTSAMASLFARLWQAALTDVGRCEKNAVANGRPLLPTMHLLGKSNFDLPYPSPFVVWQFAVARWHRADLLHSQILKSCRNLAEVSAGDDDFVRAK